MKKMNMKRLFCIAIMVVMLLSTMGVGAFAAVDQGIDVQTTEQTEDVQGDEGIELEATTEEDEATEIKVAEEPVYDYHPVSGVSVLSGHQRIKVSWPKYEPGSKYFRIKISEEGVEPVVYEYYEVVETLVEYIISRSDGKILSPDEGKLYYEDRNVGDGIYMYNGKLHNGGNFSYKVVAKTTLAVSKLDGEPAEGTTVVDAADVSELGIPALTQEGAIGAAKASASTTCVRTSAVKLQLKTKKVLTSHDKKKVKRTFKKGMTLYTCGFGVGKHMFIYGDNMYYLNRISTKNTKSITTKTPYSKAVAEYFVNSRGNGSKTNKLIWVSVYTQHIYIFTGSKGNWSMKYCWKVSTGKSKTPTIRTIDPQGSNLDSGRMIGKSKTISKKLKKRHAIPYWNCFSSYNAIHGKKAKWSIKAVPQSGGCVRNTNDHAKWVYNNCAKGTTVILF